MRASWCGFEFRREREREREKSAIPHPSSRRRRAGCVSQDRGHRSDTAATRDTTLEYIEYSEGEYHDVLDEYTEETNTDQMEPNDLQAHEMHIHFGNASPARRKANEPEPDHQNIPKVHIAWSTSPNEDTHYTQPTSAQRIRPA